MKRYFKYTAAAVSAVTMAVSAVPAMAAQVIEMTVHRILLKLQKRLKQKKQRLKKLKQKKLKKKQLRLPQKRALDILHLQERLQLLQLKKTEQQESISRTKREAKSYLSKALIVW